MINRVHAMRIQLGMSRDLLSEKSGISGVTIDMLERMPGYNPRAKTMKAVADALGANVADVFQF